MRSAKRVGVEIKRASAPKVTRSMYIIVGDLGLEEVIVLYARHDSYRLGERAGGCGESARARTLAWTISATVDHRFGPAKTLIMALRRAPFQNEEYV